CVSGGNVGIAEVVVFGPEAAFSYSPSRVLIGNTVYFSNSTNVFGSPATVYQWDFGDGSTSGVANPTHVYTQSGTYTVTLTANAGTLGRCASVATQTLVVKYFNTHFQIAPIYVSSGQCPPVLAQFTNTSINYSSVAWDFGDGTVAGNLNYPSHVYTRPGGYQ